MKAAKDATVFVWIILGMCTSVIAQNIRVDIDARSWRGNLVVPQSRTYAITQAPVVKTTRVDVSIDILEQVATTTLDIGLHNPSGSRQEAQLVVPVPDGAVVRGFTFQGAGAEPSAQILPKDDARRAYNAIVAKLKDPALLEFAGYNCIRSSVFPVDAGSTQKVRLIYETVLTAIGQRVDYILPRSETMESTIPWHIRAHLRSARPISTVYSPTHEIDTRRISESAVRVAFEKGDAVQPGMFQLSYLLGGDGVTASLFAYPDPKVGGGYFLLLAGLQADRPTSEAVKREVTLVFDRSGSMNGEKIRQVRESAMQVIAGLEPGEAFNIITYNDAVDLFATEPVLKSEQTVEKARSFINSMTARGGTNIHDALLEALRQKPRKGMLPIVLFLTDGLPTIGHISEKEIGALVESHNTYDRRVFTMGVGADVNAPLLDRIADLSRATATYVLPRENVEVKVSSVFDRLSGPILANPFLKVIEKNGAPAIGRVLEVLPSNLPDMFYGDQLVLFGKYRGDAPLRFSVNGEYLGKTRKFEFSFELDSATTRNAFVPRLWASRKIAILIDEIRQSSAQSDSVLTAARTNPRFKELIDEIVALSTEFGILTEYTAFLAREGTDLSQQDDILDIVRNNVHRRAVSTRSGIAAVNQSLNYAEQSRQKNLKKHNEYWTENMDRVQTSAVQQINDRTFYRRGTQWVDSRVAASGNKISPDAVVRVGSAEFMELADRLANQNRAGCIALKGEILLEVDGKVYLCR